jgi:Mus7/MMS22 family
VFAEEVFSTIAAVENQGSPATILGTERQYNEATIPLEFLDDTSVLHRNLRPRNALQQHPYTMEYEKYRQQVSRHGVKPVHVINESQERKNLQDNDGDDEFSEDDASEDSPPLQALESSSPNVRVDRTSRHGSTTYSLKSSGILTAPSSVDDEDEIGLEGLKRAQKRRKFGNQSTIRSHTGNTHLITSTDQENPQDMFEFPGSPLKRSGVFRPPPPLPDFMSTTPQKPPASSPRAVFDNDSDTEAEVSIQQSRRSRKKRAIESSDSEIIEESEKSECGDNAEANENAEDEEEVIMEFGKRLNGILPRSWVKQDLQRQLQREPFKKQKTPAKRPKNLEVAGAGVARTKTSTRIRHTDGDQIDNFADQVGLPGVFSPPSSADPYRLSLAPEHDLHELSSDPGSDMENNAIDWMLVPKMQQNSKGRVGYHKRTHQPRINDFLRGDNKSQHGVLESAAKPHSIGFTNGHKHIKQDKPPRKRYKQQKLAGASSISRIGILDLPAENLRVGSTVPNFLKIARRQARQNKNYGRQSPSRKFFRLSTREDTAEANELLIKWRKGSVKQRELEAKQSLPLNERSENGRPILPNVQPLNDGSSLSHPQRQEGSKRLRSAITLRSVPVKSKHNVVKAISGLFRTAQLESLESDFSLRNKRLAFKTTLRNAEVDFAFRQLVPHSINSEVARYLGKDDIPASEDLIAQSVETTEITRAKPSRRPRKAKARRLDVENANFRQTTIETAPQQMIVSNEGPQNDMLIGFAANYSDNFGILPLPHDPLSHFQTSTFIGSGSFAKAISMADRDFNKPTMESSIVLNGTQVRWSAWNEQMASDMHTGFQRYSDLIENVIQATSVAEVLQHKNCVDSFLREFEDMLRLLREALYFFDPVDCSDFVSRMHDLLDPLRKATLKCLQSVERFGSELNPWKGRILCFLSRQLCLAAQIKAIESKYSTDRAQGLVSNNAEALSKGLVIHGLHLALAAIQRNNDLLEREIGFGQEDFSVESVVILNNILQQTDPGNNSIWTTFNNQMMPRVNAANQVSDLEAVWRDLFTILPLLEVDETGLGRIGKRFEASMEDWSLVKAILQKTFDYYDQQSKRAKGPNVYIRTVLRRCHYLIQSWGWTQCDSIVSLIFDFFGKQKLQPLSGEETRGSPKFLKMLNDNPSLELAPQDPSFHIFLKILALALRVLKSKVSEKKLKGLIVRCMPNHNRQYLKEEMLDMVDLEALRNHHDLLSTLFWCATSDLRSRILGSIRSLVDHQLSHRYACQQSIQSWTNLIRFTLSADGTSYLLGEFSCWIKDSIQHAISLYHLAGSEGVSKSDKKFNQSGILQVLGDAAFALVVAMKNAKSQAQVVELVEDCSVEKLLLLPDHQSTHATNLMLNALKVYSIFLDLPVAVAQAASKGKEESQDYGEWPEDVVSIGFIPKNVFQFLSNVFGSDKPLSEDLAKASIDVWVKILARNVTLGETDWNTVLEPYSEHAWDRLNNNDHKRKYTVYFYAAVVQRGSGSLKSVLNTVLSAWVVSLVERESMLKFQHNLTSLLLNSLPQNGLLQNLPFWRERSGAYEINLEDLRKRRLSLLSTVLGNMQSLFYNSPSDEERSLIKGLLKDLMHAMKKNYLELGEGDHVRGAYVSFVHEVIGFLHHHTAEICAIDQFFTKPSEFPLPTQDPTYVVATLKGYGSRLFEQRVSHRMVHFLENLCERAILENKVDTLIEQLKKAADQTTGDDIVSLRTAFIRDVFPAYIEKALSSEVGWLFCLPILPVLSELISNTVYQFNLAKTGSVLASLEVLQRTLAILQQTAQAFISNSQILKLPYCLRMLHLILRVVKSALSSLDHIQRITKRVSPASESVGFFREFSVYCVEVLLDLEPDLPQFCPPKQFGPSQLQVYSANALRETLKHWHKDSQDIYIIKSGGTKKKVNSTLGTFEQERLAFIEAVEDFSNVLNRMKTL